MKSSMKTAMVVLTFILAIAVVLFWRQVWGIFAGMSVLEAMNTIVTFILHVTVATISVYALTLIPEYVLPWLKVFRIKQRRAMKARRHGRMPEQAVKAPRMNFNKMLLSLLARQAPSAFDISTKRRARLWESEIEEPTIRLDL
jgi:MFS superfamily sulfate permease-like transporter